MQDLRRANNHNLATIEDLQTFLNLIEETDEIDQYNNIRLKKNQGLTIVQTIIESKEEVTSPTRKTATSMTGKTLPVINTETNTMRITDRNTNENPVKREKHHLRIDMNQT